MTNTRNSNTTDYKKEPPIDKESIQLKNAIIKILSINIKEEELTLMEERVMVSIMLDYYVSHVSLISDIIVANPNIFFNYYTCKSFANTINTALAKEKMDIIRKEYSIDFNEDFFSFSSFTEGQRNLLVASRSVIRIYKIILEKFLQYGLCLESITKTDEDFYKQIPWGIKYIKPHYEHTFKAKTIKDLNNIINIYQIIYDTLIYEINYLGDKDELEYLKKTLEADRKNEKTSSSYLSQHAMFKLLALPDYEKTVNQYLQYKKTCQDIELGTKKMNYLDAPFNRLEKELDSYFKNPSLHFAICEEEIRKGEVERAIDKINLQIDKQ